MIFGKYRITVFLFTDDVRWIVWKVICNDRDEWESQNITKHLRSDRLEKSKQLEMSGIGADEYIIQLDNLKYYFKSTAVDIGNNR